jgi:thymidylate synthase (FAD)
MNIVKPYASLMDVQDRDAGIALLKKIEWCGRISHRSEEAQTGETWERFIRTVVLQHGDWSIVEHASATVDFLVDRGITHELVRHRLCAFTQESTRFVNYEKKMPPSFIDPFTSVDATSYKGGASVQWDRAINACEEAYKQLLACGAAPQIARSVFPNALASRIVVTSNLRNWRHVLIMRTTREAHPQMREVMIPLLAEFKERIPILFEDIEPMAKQSEAIRSGR